MSRLVINVCPHGRYFSYAVMKNILIGVQIFCRQKIINPRFLKFLVLVLRWKNVFVDLSQNEKQSEIKPLLSLHGL